jgi:hypothetical protein
MERNAPPWAATAGCCVSGHGRIDGTNHALTRCCRGARSARCTWAQALRFEATHLGVSKEEAIAHADVAAGIAAPERQADAAAIHSGREREEACGGDDDDDDVTPTPQRSDEDPTRHAICSPPDQCTWCASGAGRTEEGLVELQRCRWLDEESGWHVVAQRGVQAAGGGPAFRRSERIVTAIVVEPGSVRGAPQSRDKSRRVA